MVYGQYFDAEKGKNGCGVMDSGVECEGFAEEKKKKKEAREKTRRNAGTEQPRIERRAKVWSDKK